MEVPPSDKFGRPLCNHPFVVERCKEVQQTPDDEWTLDLWARWHFKSSIITRAKTIQRICTFPERCTMIVSHTRPAAKKHIRPIVAIMEGNQSLKNAFPDILYQNPRNESPKWSEDDGYVVKRASLSRMEATLEAHGIKEGMPIGVHFDYILPDDLETKDDVVNPDVVIKVRDAIDLTDDLLTMGGVINVAGTPYSHEGVYIPYLVDKKKADGTPVFHYRRYPATIDGLPNGKPVFMDKQDLDDIRARKGEYNFNCQQLINPTPMGVSKLSGERIVEVDPLKIPRNLLKFMAIDPAGDDKDGKGDSWAFGVIGLDLHMDDVGASDIYILDLIVSPMREEEAPEEIARMYMRNGWILQVGVEKVGQSTTELHVANTLKKYGRFISQDNRSLVILRPAGRNKISRIEKALPFPLYNSKIHISTDVPNVYRERARMEMDKFPYWKDDFLDMLTYFYEMIRDYHFHLYMQDEEENTVSNVVQMRRNAVTGY